MAETADGKVAIVTGAARGIGLGIARALHAAGYRVAATDRDGPGAERAAAELGEAAIGLGHDVASADDWQEVVAAVLDRWGRIDLLVNHAGISPRDSIDSLDEAAWEATFAVNLKGPWLGIRACLPALRAARGRIVNTGSTHATLPLRGLFSYTISKAGLLGLTRQTALDLLDDGITCNMVAPGWVASPGEVAIQKAEGRDDFPAGIARMSTPEDVGAAVVYLASPAARHVNGELLHLDGGLHAIGDVRRVHFPETGL